ncbi:MAG: hypothetical protein P9M08_06235 [Candidatus Erginobacter occultus]|nr:hypothetical protein [Candidatus Erginobacter occultus]
MADPYDSREIYCRKLGHYLTFRYCRTERDGLPCGKIKDCWFDKIPIGDYLRDNYSPGELARIIGPPPAKAATLVELIERARRRAAAPPPATDGDIKESIN